MTGLTLGALDLLGEDRTGPFYIEALGDNATLGNPAPIEREIESFLQDGAIVAVDSYGNREMTISVRITGEDSPGLAAGEQALMSEIRRRNVLTWTPPNPLGDGDPCVFDVVHSEIEHQFDDLLEVQAYQRVYSLTIKALPHARSGNVRTVSMAAPAGGVTPTVVSVDSGSSASGWSGTANDGTSPTVSSNGSAVRVDWSNTSGADLDANIDLYRQSIGAPMSTTPYVRIDFTSGGTGRYEAQTDYVFINGVYLAPVASNGSVRWYLCPHATLNSVRVMTGSRVSRFGKLWVSVNDVSRTSLPQDASGTRQMFATVEVKGSARTEAAVTVADETPTGLGSVLVYTAPNVGPVAQPPLRARLAAGPVETTSTALISGKSSDLSTVHSFDIPVTQVPAGSYLLVARVKHASAGSRSVAWASRSRMNGTELAAGALTGSRTVTLAADTWTIAPVAVMPLPGRVMGDAGVVRVELSGPAGLLLDEAWLFNMTTGSLSWVECGAGSPGVAASNRLWLTPPSLENPVTSVARGTAADQSDAFYPSSSLGALETHEFVPPLMNVFVATSDSTAMQVAATYSPRFHTHVVEG